MNEAVRKTEPAEAQAWSITRRGGLRLLLIDDNPDDRTLVLRALRKEFPRLQATEVLDENGLERALLTAAFDLAITDYQLNWSTGLALLPRLRERLPGCPVVMFTATGTEEIAVEAMKRGLDDYVIKTPRHFVRLAAAARSALDKAAERIRADRLQSRLQDLLTRLNVGVYRATRGGIVLDSNLAFWRLFGIASLEEARNWRLKPLLARPEEFDAIEHDLEQNGQVRVAELLLAGGPVTWISLSLTLRESGEGSIVEGLVEDVTERKRLDLALRRKDKELREVQRLESIGRLAGGVAHDFNNLLTAINGYSELTLGMVEGGNPLRENLVEIKKAGERAAALTWQLLAFSRRQMLQPRLLDLNAVITSLQLSLQDSLGGSIRLYTDLDPELDLVRADPDQMEQVILNLAMNARDAMPEGGIFLIETGNAGVTRDETGPLQGEGGEALRPGRYVLLMVADMGMGMDAEIRASAFEPFFTTKPMGTGPTGRTGMGLGLSTAYGIIKQSGGYVQLESEPGRGTRFRIYLPRAEGDPLIPTQPAGS